MSALWALSAALADSGAASAAAIAAINSDLFMKRLRRLVLKLVPERAVRSHTGFVFAMESYNITVRNNILFQNHDDLCALLRQQNLDPIAFENWRIDLGRLAKMFFGIC